MKTTPYHNDGDTTVHIGGKMIAPGDTRDVDASLVPAEPQPEPEPDAPPSDPIEQLAELTSAEIIDALGDLDDADIVRLANIEESRERPRKGVLKALSEEILARTTGPDADDGGQDSSE